MNDVWANLLKLERRSVCDRCAALQICEGMRLNERLCYLVLGFQSEVIFLEIGDVVDEAYRMKRAIFGFLEILELSANNQIPEDCFQFRELLALIRAALRRQ